MAHSGTDGLWQRNGRALARNALPISNKLRKRHIKWCQKYEMCTDNLTGFDFVKFSREGYEIACAIKTELPEWTVIYFDEASAISAFLTDLPDPPRGFYEFEIHEETGRRMRPGCFGS